MFGVVFAMNSSLHSYLILAYSDDDEVALDVGFYYSANAAGRLVGTLLSACCTCGADSISPCGAPPCSSRSPGCSPCACPPAKCSVSLASSRAATEHPHARGHRCSSLDDSRVMRRK